MYSGHLHLPEILNVNFHRYISSGVGGGVCPGIGQNVHYVTDALGGQWHSRQLTVRPVAGAELARLIDAPLRDQAAAWIRES